MEISKSMVNKKLKEFRMLVKTGLIDPRVWLAHFGYKRPDKFKCRDCVDFMSKRCAGGIAPFECMKFGIYIDLSARLDSTRMCEKRRI